MQCQFKSVAVRRLQFAAAELEVVSEIAKRDGDAALREHLCSLTDRVKDCINAVSNGNKSNSFLGI
jgi:hypothetical protein